jgi:hypothetical protein
VHPNARLIYSDAIARRREAQKRCIRFGVCVIILQPVSLKKIIIAGLELQRRDVISRAAFHSVKNARVASVGATQESSRQRTAENKAANHKNG